jgi:hypothetical protein
MATTAPDAALRLLDHLHHEGFKGALLHGADRIEQHELRSDLDLVCEAPIIGALEDVEKAAEAVGFVPVLLWPYDVNAVTVLLVKPEWDNVLPAVQVDLLVDPKGLGKYGVRTDVLLRDAVAAGRFRILSPLDGWLYLWRKAWTKGQPDRLRKAADELGSFDPLAVRARAEAVFAWGPAPAAARMPSKADVRLQRLGAQAGRLAWRAMTPIGCELRDLPRGARRSLLPLIRSAFPHAIERHSRIPFRWSLAARRPLVALAGPATDALPRKALRSEAVVGVLHEHYRRTRCRYTSSRLLWQRRMRDD